MAQEGLPRLRDAYAVRPTLQQRHTYRLLHLPDTRTDRREREVDAGCAVRKAASFGDGNEGLKVDKAKMHRIAHHEVSLDSNGRATRLACEQHTWLNERMSIVCRVPRRDTQIAFPSLQPLFFFVQLTVAYKRPGTAPPGGHRCTRS